MYNTIHLITNPCSLYWQRATTTDSYTKSCHITGLKEGREYLFRVIAVNDIGESDGLESDLAVRPIRVQGKKLKVFLSVQFLNEIQDTLN